MIRGTNFSGASVVWFNGTNATFVLNSGNQITATVPSGAITGSVSVIAPGGLATSLGNFTAAAPPPPPAIAPAFSLVSYTGNQFQFVVSGTAGSNYVVQATTNLDPAIWISLQTNAAPFTFSEPNAFDQQFYRALVAP